MRRFRLTLIVVFLSMISCYAHAAGMTVVNGRYFADASGTPKFLIGYHDFTLGSTLVNAPYTFGDMINAYSTYGLTYMRQLVSQYRFTASTSPPSWDGSTSRTPWAYASGLANFDQWDSTFWTNLKADIAHAASHGIFIHLTVFDGCGLSPGSEPYTWGGNPWNVNNQTRSFFGDLDANSNGRADDDNEFYNTASFNANVPGTVGYYQKRLIDKLIAEVDSYPNVFYEVGNETGLGTGVTWAEAVRAYMVTKTNKPVTLETCSHSGYGQSCTLPSSSIGGWISHQAGDTVQQAKDNEALIVGHGYPAMTDPDGPYIGASCTPAECRELAWYALTGGAFGWGGFSEDTWDTDPGYPDTTKATYYKYLLQFLDNNAVRFWEMTPQQSLITTPTTNSLLANVGSQYLGYVLSGATVNITLGAGTYVVKYFNPVTGVTTSGTDTTGPATRTFSRPTGASDWVVFVSKNMVSFRTPVAPIAPWGLKLR